MITVRVKQGQKFGKADQYKEGDILEVPQQALIGFADKLEIVEFPKVFTQTDGEKENDVKTRGRPKKDSE